jgi:hypothetical protein
LNISGIFAKVQSVTDPPLNAPSHRSRRPSAVLAQSSIAWAIDSIANPHLNNDLGAIITFPDENMMSRSYIRRSPVTARRRRCWIARPTWKMPCIRPNRPVATAWWEWIEATRAGAITLSPPATPAPGKVVQHGSLARNLRRFRAAAPGCVRYRHTRRWSAYP